MTVLPKIYQKETFRLSLLRNKCLCSSSSSLDLPLSALALSVVDIVAYSLGSGGSTLVETKPKIVAIEPVTSNTEGYICLNAKSASIAKGIVSDNATVEIVGLVRVIAQAHSMSDRTLSINPFNNCKRKD